LRSCSQFKYVVACLGKKPLRGLSFRDRSHQLQFPNVEVHMKSGESGERIGKMIKKAIEDGKLTNSEYEQILAIAEADFVIDAQEKKLLAELQELLANKTVIRVAD